MENLIEETKFVLVECLVNAGLEKEVASHQIAISTKRQYALGMLLLWCNFSYGKNVPQRRVEEQLELWSLRQWMKK
jgi:hypothetical protein